MGGTADAYRAQIGRAVPFSVSTGGVLREMYLQVSWCKDVFCNTAFWKSVDGAGQAASIVFNIRAQGPRSNMQIGLHKRHDEEVGRAALSLSFIQPSPDYSFTMMVSTPPPLLAVQHAGAGWWPSQRRMWRSCAQIGIHTSRAVAPVP